MTKTASNTVTMRVPKDTRDTIKKLSDVKGQTIGETVSVQFAQDKTAGNATKEQGVIYISNSGNVYKPPKATAETVREMLENPYIASKLNKRMLTFFPYPLEMEVTDPKQKVSPEETQKFQIMCDAVDVRLNEKAIIAYFDTESYGPGIFNPVWLRRGGEIYLSQLRRLPPWSFDTEPTSLALTQSWSPLLPGIILGADGKPQYWQRQGDLTLDPIQITDIFVVKNPLDELISGNSKIIRLANVINMLKYAWNTEMQCINQAGAPIFFIRVTQPKTAEELNGAIGDVDYAQKILSRGGKDTRFQLRENMEIVPVNLVPGKDVLTTEAALKAVIDDYFNISDQIQKDGPTVGDTSSSALDIHNQAAAGVHTWLFPYFENLLNEYFWRNKYPPGWTLKIKGKLPEPDTTAADQKDAELGIAGQCVDLDDLRKKLHYEPADDEKKASILAFWASKVPAPVASVSPAQVGDKSKPAQFTKPAHDHAHEGDDIQDPIGDEMAAKLNAALDKLSEEILAGYPA